MAVTIGGARRLAPGLAPRLLIRFLVNQPPGMVVNLRSGILKIGRFEQDVATLCAAIKQPIRWWVPDITKQTIGRTATWVRDIDMVAASELVLAFVSVDDIEGRSGTVHLIDKAQDQGIPCYMYAVEKDGKVWLSGSTDPENAWKERVPAA